MELSDQNKQYVWPSFYQAIANELRKYRNKRQDLLNAIKDIQEDKNSNVLLSYLHDSDDGVDIPLEDICPFTIFASFNRRLKTKNRIAVATAIAQLLNVSEPVPHSFRGVPCLMSFNSRFYGNKKDRSSNDIDTLWDVFDCALEYADEGSDETRKAFAEAFDKALRCRGTSWNLTIGLYWIRPWSFLTLDGQSRIYIEKALKEHIDIGGSKKIVTSKSYLSLCDRFKSYFEDSQFVAHSFPELSFKAFQYDSTKKKEKAKEKASVANKGAVLVESVEASQTSSYSIKNICNEGSFVSEIVLERILERFAQKKNLILQGPPGTGKTWLAKRLAYALIGQEATDRVRAVQFHPNLSYEDFVRGWRPNEGGTLALTDGPFMEMVEAAKRNKGDKFVLIIEEINRGNPAQIFGEVLTLIESDKRSPKYSLELSYRREKNERVYIPDNLYVIGTMNIADRSLAQIDLALRRRFAFIDLKPELGDAWREFLIRNFGFQKLIVDKIQKRIVDLNDQISKDPRLGTQFCVGHSFVTPSLEMEIEDAQDWFKQVVETEIGPLLCHYWFDDLDKAQNAKEALLKDL